MRAKARAHSNIALIKYWGKRDERLNLPAVGSISLTLSALWTETEIEFSPQFQTDQLILNDKTASPEETGRTSRFLDVLRKLAGINHKAVIQSHNNFPTAAGLASSASGFAALTLAAARALHLSLSRKELSVLARQGSGSAARSIPGGFVEMHAGQSADGSDAFAEPIAPPAHWDIRLLIGITSGAAKKIGSTAGMNLSKTTSPYYQAWIDAQHADLTAMRQAILDRDFERLGELSEYSCLKMHALALSSNPGILYWNGVTVEAMHAVRDLRRRGTPAYFTIDAGPQIKVLCLPEDENEVREMLESIPGIREVVSNKPGPDARILEADE
ncbi:diphosphomevalonate decarboxylase [Caldithrix abyssi]|uniref:diphosphomevalonate decarboxylase n=1 Tax=Caldithrix abyssi DSM 13497 TaxID=880073 RepID=H1XYN5_CALAY|nr:diphosphomevalonate decarboxylase [Caldithrix abyssi]APF20589.1 diphosphomevalonate decarboxylase [Caldithrix abyssi DSM 13497]EHO40904.1 diphosphomevalonate decarboxylase [Caldithrix abyssi DSM 13497]